MMNATQGQAEAVTVVFWDIMTYPVPSGCDAGVVGQCITRYLRQLGYCGPLDIIAVGLLTDVNQDVLRAVSSTGIVLNHVLLGSIGILRSMDTWKQTRRPPANMMLISSDESIIPRIRHSSGYNIFRLFPDESLWLEFFLQDSDTLMEEDKCSVTSASDLWICSVCTDHLVSQGYEKFTTHLYSEEHQIKANRVEVEAMAQTSVIWDIKGCPVPPGCDARRVRSCIEEYLNDFGYFGPLTITAVGLLTDVNQDVLRAVSSTGIILRHMDVNKSGDISSVMYLHPRSPTIMVICPYSELSAKVVGDLLDLDYNMIELFPYNSPYSESLWKKFLLEGVCFSSVCSERSEYASWVCSVFHDISGNGFDDFITHIFSPEHIPEEYDEDDDAVTVFWDINGYPVPSVCDPRLVRQCIEEYLKDCGYNGPFTINAIGRLTEVPPDVLEALSSTGIILRNILCDPADIMYRWASANPSPANLMVICPYSTKVRSKKYGIIVPFRHESRDPDSDSDCPWEHFLLSYSEKETFEEEEEYNCYTAPAQPQQWNPAYGQQAAYGAYGGYPPGSTASAQPQQWNHAYGQQAAYGAYGGYPPGSAASAQPQQWNHAYGQQAAYHSYGGYPTGYTAPQAPAPVPLAAAYGAYPAQTYPTQSYAPPFVTVAPVVEHVQQPITAAAPQSYYNTYY